MGVPRTVADVLEAPSKGAAATLRYLTTGEEPRLEPGSSWKLAGPGLAEMASSGYSDIGELIARELYPEAEGTNMKMGRRVGSISQLPFGAVLEGAPTASLARTGLLGTAKLAQRTSPLAKLLRQTPYSNFPITQHGIDTAVARVGPRLQGIDAARQQAGFWLQGDPNLGKYLGGLASREAWLVKAKDAAEASRNAARYAETAINAAGAPIPNRLATPVSQDMLLGLVPTLVDMTAGTQANALKEK